MAASMGPVEALQASHFGRLPMATIEQLAVDSRRVVAGAGSLRHREGDELAHLDVVMSGFARAYVSAPDGRSLTIRYCRPGAILGAVSLYSSPFVMPASVQCLVTTEFLALAPARVRSMVREDPALAEALLGELAERVATFIAEIPGSAFATVRQRVARHLLDMASEEQQGSRLVARVSQAELADSVGTSREVVVPILRDLRAARLVATARSGITVLAPERLFAETYPATMPGPEHGSRNLGS